MWFYADLLLTQWLPVLVQSTQPVYVFSIQRRALRVCVLIGVIASCFHRACWRGVRPLVAIDRGQCKLVHFEATEHAYHLCPQPPQ